MKSFLKKKYIPLLLILSLIFSVSPLAALAGNVSPNITEAVSTEYFNDVTSGNVNHEGGMQNLIPRDTMTVQEAVYGEDENIASVRMALGEIKLENLKLIDGEDLNPENVLYDIQLVDPRDFGDKATGYISEPWASDNPDVIKINYMRGKVTRPPLGEPDVTVTLTVSAFKGEYTESKSFTVTVKAITEEELNEAASELDAVKNALTFDMIKKDNISADAVTSNLQVVYRGIGYPDVNWETINSGEKGIKIEWETDDDSVIKSYGTVSRPSTIDKPAVLTAILTPFRLAEYIEPRTVEIPLIIRKISRSAEVADIILSPDLNFNFDAEKNHYDIPVPAIVDNLNIDIIAEETGTLIISNGNSGRGTLSLDIGLIPGEETTVKIRTEALDSESFNEYTLSFKREAVDETEKNILAIISTIKESYKNTSSDWEAMSMAALGEGHRVAGLDIINNSRRIYKEGNTTDLARSIITLTALGVDATNVYSGNEGVYLDFLGKISENHPSQIMESIFGLIALDSGGYGDENLNFNRQHFIDFLLERKTKAAGNGYGWAMRGDSPDIDTTAMALTALSPYYDEHDDIKNTIEGGLEYLSSQQKDSGDFGSTDSTSAVIIALTALGENPDKNTGEFAKSNNSLIDGLLTFRTDSDKFGYSDNKASNTMSTEQGFRALIAYRGFLTSKNGYNIYRFGPQTGDGTGLTGETDPGNLPPDPDAPKTVTVRIEDLSNGNTPMQRTTVTIAGTHLDALKEALRIRDKDPDTELIETYGMITSILGVSQDITTGWMYAVNGEIPSSMISETPLQEGDDLVMFYIDWSDEFYFTAFDKTLINIEEGESVTLWLTGLNPWDAMESTGEYLPISGAEVFVRDLSGHGIGTRVVTNEDGKATLSFSDAGTYTISASKKGNINKSSLVPPLCEVIVTSATKPEPDNTISAYFTLRGLNEKNNKEETWINNKKVSSIEKDATVADVIVKALRGAGYSQRGAQSGYISSVTTPEGFKLEEMHDGMPHSGWLYKLNSKLSQLGMDSQKVRDGDRILLYFTMDYTKDPDAGDVSGKGKEAEEKRNLDIEIKTKVKDSIATGTVDIEDITKVLDEIIKSDKSNKEKEITVQIEVEESISILNLDMKGNVIKALAGKGNIKLTVENPIARLSLDKDTLLGISQDISNSSVIELKIKSIDASKAGKDIGKIIGDFPAFEFNIQTDDKKITGFKGEVSVFLPYVPKKGTKPEELTVYFLGEGKNPVPMGDTSFDVKQGGYIFTTTHFSLFYIGAIKDKWVNHFLDVKDSDWFYEAVKYVNTKNLMMGTGADSFSPDMPMTRSMIVTTLRRYEGKPSVNHVNPFADVPDDEWYTDSVLWAQQNDIVTGYGEGLFGPDDNVTREQIATILKNYIQWQGLDTSKRNDISRYTDAKDVSPWAMDSVEWANALGLIEGKTEKILAPKKYATRAEVATILYRIYSRILK